MLSCHERKLCHEASCRATDVVAVVVIAVFLLPILILFLIPLATVIRLAFEAVRRDLYHRRQPLLYPFLSSPCLVLCSERRTTSSDEILAPQALNWHPCSPHQPPRSAPSPVDWLNVALLRLVEQPLHVAAAGDEVAPPHCYWLATNRDHSASCDGSGRLALLQAQLQLLLAGYVM